MDLQSGSPPRNLEPGQGGSGGSSSPSLSSCSLTSSWGPHWLSPPESHGHRPGGPTLTVVEATPAPQSRAEMTRDGLGSRKEVGITSTHIVHLTRQSQMVTRSGRANGSLAFVCLADVEWPSQGLWVTVVIPRQVSISPWLWATVLPPLHSAHRALARGPIRSRLRVLAHRSIHPKRWTERLLGVARSCARSGRCGCERRRP